MTIHHHAVEFNLSTQS